MKGILSLAAAALFFFQASQAVAENQFATTESFAFYEDMAITTSLYATADQEPDADGFYSFEGRAITQEGSVPITVYVPDDERIPELGSAIAVGDVELVPVDSFAFPIGGGAEARKYFYRGASEYDTYSLVLTDDPFPLLARLVRAAGVAALTWDVLNCIITVSENAGDVTIRVEVQVIERELRVSVQCE